MKTITIEVSYPQTITASDSEGQHITIQRIRDAGNPSDSDICTVESHLMGDETPVMGNCQWHEAFATIGVLMNATTCD